MTSPNRGRQKARAAAGLLLLAGVLLGIAVDRMLLQPSHLEATPLTAQALAAQLELSPADEARMRALLDSIHAEITAAAEQDPDSLKATARTAHDRLMAALPAHVRPGFRSWMHDHHVRMIERVHGTRAHGS